MDFIRTYRAYLNDNPRGYWFKNKAYGWGWVPVRWQGWAVLLLYMIVLIPIIIALLSIQNPSSGDIVRFLLEVLAAVTALILVCYITGEPPKWQWGIPDKKD